MSKDWTHQNEPQVVHPRRLAEPSWNCDEVYDVLRRHNAAYCIHELAGFHTPILLTANFSYIRLHGPGGKYQGCYAEDKLSEWAERIADWSSKLRAIYIYFDNDDSGYAPRNALELKQLVEKSFSTQRHGGYGEKRIRSA